MKSRLVVSGSFGLHLLYGILEDLFVAHVGLDQLFEAGNHSLGLLVKLNRKESNIYVWELMIYGGGAFEHRVIDTQHEQWSVVDTHSGYVDIVIVRQRVQHLHHWCFDQFQCESTNTAAPERTHTYSHRLKYACFSRISPRLQSGTADRPVQHWTILGSTFCSSSFYKL